MAKYGVVVTNIGTPQSTSSRDVARYLREFLMDKYVIDTNWFSRFVLVNGIIAPFRAPKSAQAYEKVWTDRGSPLLFHTEDYCQELQKILGEEYKVVVGMRYGQPSMSDAIDQVADCEEIVLFPHYPQFAESSTRSSIEHFDKLIGKKGIGKPTYRIGPFFNDISYIDSVAQKIQDELAGRSVDHFLFSYHGLPERHLKKIDPTGEHCGNYEYCCDRNRRVMETCYRAQCFATSRSLAVKLSLPGNYYSVSFQSRLGREVWIPPYTDEVLAELPKKGIKRLAVACPSFVTDCLETLEEIAQEGRDTFLEAGGEEFIFLPCLNTHPKWVQAGANMILRLTQHSMSEEEEITLITRPEAELS